MITKSPGHVASVLGVLTLVAAGVSGLATPSNLLKAEAADPEESPKDIIATQIRRQGVACGTALSAERDEALTKPNEAVWHLKCDNATYQVRLVPDMAAKVQRID